jgi:alpha-ribazole phosphatase
VMRHGQTALDVTHRSDGWIDLPLSSEGNEGVVATLADFLKYIPITCIYCSHLIRTKETAHIVASGLLTHPEIEVAEEAATWNLGAMAGDAKRPNKVAVKYLLTHPDVTPEGGESYGEFKARFLPWLEKMKKDAKKDGPLLLILSGSACRLISEELFHDRGELDIDESGLFVMFPEEGKWTANVITGHRDDDARDNNPEAS